MREGHTVVSVRMTTAERAAMKRLAARKGMELSQAVRHLVRQSLEVGTIHILDDLLRLDPDPVVKDVTG